MGTSGFFAVLDLVGDDAFALVALGAGIGVVAGVLEIAQHRLGKGFPIPLLIYAHLAFLTVFVFTMLGILGEEEIKYWPLYLTLAPLPFIVLGRVLPVTKG